MVRRLRFGLIGCGLIGSGLDAGRSLPYAQTHASALLKNSAVELAALCDCNESQLQEAGRVRGVTHLYTNHRDMLAHERLDAVSLCTPGEGRLVLIGDVLDAGIKIIWCEKPVATTLSEAAQITQLVQQHGAICNVNFLRRYSPVLHRLRQYVKENTYGDLQSIQAVYTKGLNNNGSHVIDFVVALLGAPEKMQKLSRLDDGRVADPTVSVYLEFMDKDRKAVPLLLNAADYRHYSVMEWDFFFTGGRVRMYDLGRRQADYAVVPDSMFSGYKSLDVTATTVYEDGFDNLFERTLENLLEASSGKGTLASPLSNSLALMQIVNDITSI